MGLRGKFQSLTRFEVGYDSNVRFWHDLWHGDMVLREAFPSLFGIACANDAFVANRLEIPGGSI
jgi:hypothetical protein